MALKIRFDYDNALQFRVGNEGLDPSWLNAKTGAEVVDSFRQRVDSGEIGFPTLPDDRKTAAAITSFAEDLRPGIDDVLLLGIGGSALGAYALDIAIRGPHPVQMRGGKRNAAPRLVVLDNVDPGPVAAALATLNPKRTAVVVVAKSGSTAETLATFLIVRD
ncbi:MAG: hypothetical protein AB7O65_14100, partial [Candidatus Korobacteraceae bacterium]